jgi:DNA-directed RNA polymerase specialized sigma24 family protein
MWYRGKKPSQIADALEMSVETARRDVRLVLAFLRKELSNRGWSAP